MVLILTLRALGRPSLFKHENIKGLFTKTVRNIAQTTEGGSDTAAASRVQN